MILTDINSEALITVFYENENLYRHRHSTIDARIVIYFSPSPNNIDLIK